MKIKAFQFRVTEKFAYLLDEMIKDCNVEDRSDIIRDAVSYYNFMVNHIKNGNKIYSLNPEQINGLSGGTEIIFPDGVYKNKNTI